MTTTTLSPVIRGKVKVVPVITKTASGFLAGWTLPEVSTDIGPTVYTNQSDAAQVAHTMAVSAAQYFSDRNGS